VIPYDLGASRPVPDRIWELGGKQEHLDGLTVEYANWWFNLRESHTEPVVRLVMEAEDEETLQEAKAKVMTIIDFYVEPPA